MSTALLTRLMRLEKASGGNRRVIVTWQSEEETVVKKQINDVLKDIPPDDVGSICRKAIDILLLSGDIPAELVDEVHRRRTEYRRRNGKNG